VLESSDICPRLNGAMSESAGVKVGEGMHPGVANPILSAHDDSPSDVAAAGEER
jgi:hypothetical protein